MRTGWTLALFVLGACARERPTTAPEVPPASVSAPPPAASSVEVAAPSATQTASATPTVRGTVRPGCERRGYVAPAGAKLTMRAVSQGALVNVTFVNEGTEPVCLLTHVEAGGAQFDWIRVTLSGGPGPSRNLTFVDDRDKSAHYSVELGPAGRHTETIDLGAWAARRVNGGRPLAAGGYVVDIQYDSSRETWAWSGTLHTTANVVIPVTTSTILTSP